MGALTRGRAIARAAWLALALCVVGSTASAQVVQPLGSRGQMGLGTANGDFFVVTDDLEVKVPGGYARISRDFDGTQWVFNRRWSGLGSPDYYRASYPSIGSSYSCTEIDGVLSCDTTASSGGGVTVPVALGVTQTRVPTDPNFGRDANGNPVAVPGMVERIARKGLVFARSSDGTSFTNTKYPRYVIRPQWVPVLPASNGPDAHPAAGTPGQGGLALTQVQGFRWTDRSGAWIEYDGFGRISSYGDRNDQRVWMQYSASHGNLERVLDANGRTVFTLLYTADGKFITEARDHTAPSGIRRVKYDYDGSGRLVGVTDARDNLTTFGYGTQGGGAVNPLPNTFYKIKTVVDAENRTTQVTYGSTGRIDAIIAPDQGVTNFEYGYDKLTREFSVTVKFPQTEAGRRIETRRYDAEGRIVFQEVNGKTLITSRGDARSLTYFDERNGTTQVVRDNFDEITKLTYADGKSRTYEYEAGSTDIREAIDEAGVVRHFDYDDRGNVERGRLAVGKPEVQTNEYERDPLGRTRVARRLGGANPDGSADVDVEVRLDYDANDNVSVMYDGENKAWHYDYDHQGNLTRVTDPLQHEWVYTYDAHGNLESETDPNLHRVTYTYDKTDRVLTLTDARNKTTHFGYDAAGRGTTETDPYGAAWTDTYNTAGEMVTRDDGGGITATMGYDSSGRLTKVVDGEQFTTLLDYAEGDGIDHGSRRVGKITYPTFQRQFRYDSRKRPIQQADLLGTDTITTGATHDARGRVETMTDNDGNTQSFLHDGIGRTVTVIDQTGATVKLDYDHRNNLVKLTDARSKVSRFEYDRRGLVTAETNAQGETTRYRYDDAGNLEEILRPTGVRIGYRYDPAGRLEERTAYRADGSVEQVQSFTWDAADNLETWNTGTASGLLHYDDVDRLLDETVTVDGVALARAYTYYPNGKVRTYTGPDGVTLTYTWNANAQLERVDIPGEGSISMTEWAWNLPKKIVLPGGTVQEYERDGLGAVTRLRVKAPNQSTVFDLENHFGSLRQLDTRTVDGKATRFEYDEAVRLTKADPDYIAGHSETFVIDKAGNRESHSAVSGTWSYDDANRLLARGDVTYHYDAAGNLESKVDAGLAEPLRTTHFEYDAFNRLVAVRDGANALVAAYTYDPFDNRLTKEVFAAGAARGATLGKLLFLQGEEGLLAELAPNGAVLRSYGWHPDHPYSTYPLFQRAGGQYFYYHNDHLGTPWRVTDKAGVVVWSATEYTAFGTATVAANAQMVQPWRFAGQYFDAETGLHYNLRRYYEAQTGRYVTQDPLGLAAGTNYYAYANHSPGNFIDPTGEIVPFLMCMGANYLRCVAACVAIDSIIQLIKDPCSLDWNILKDCAKDCLWDLIPIPTPCSRTGKLIAGAIGVYAAASEAEEVYDAVSGPSGPSPKKNSFVEGTLVATPEGLRSIEGLRPGDLVLSFDEMNRTTRPEAVTDIALSRREQKIVTLTLKSGQKIEVTGGHPLHTPVGWRAAQLLEAGGQLDVKDSAGKLSPVEIVGVSVEDRVVPVYNLEVAHTHSYFVGSDGVLVHNGVERHHSDPQFLGGEKNQPLTDLDEATHHDLHNDMNRHLDGYSKNGRTMRPKRGNCGALIRETFSRVERLGALKDFYRGVGSKYTQAALDFFKQHPGL